MTFPRNGQERLRKKMVKQLEDGDVFVDVSLSSLKDFGWLQLLLNMSGCLFLMHF